MLSFCINRKHHCKYIKFLWEFELEERYITKTTKHLNQLFGPPQQLCLDCSIPTHDENFEIASYKLFKVNHPSNTKQRGVCIYHKIYPPSKMININSIQE